MYTTTDAGTGSKLADAVIVGTGVSSLVSSLVSLYSIWLQFKNYRKPLLQRYVVRILLMVPIYAAASWAAIMSLNAAFYLDPLRDAYEAFTIYTFVQLLINFLGGERSLIIMTHGRQPVSHPWPISLWCSKMDISDPHTFLLIKRGILQYAWLKPILSAATIILKLTGTYKEGYLSWDSGYLWTGILFNISVTLSLYFLAMFWVCMNNDLKPFRPMPKFLCIKLLIFASYWQGFFLSILQFLGAIPSDVPGYTPDNLAAAIQDALICFEMPIFSIAHWYAFSWHDYADDTISAARLPVTFAFRDAFGIRDLIEDTKETMRGKHYDYRHFDSGDNVIAHEESHSRIARMMDGMRYERGGKGKYWIPKPQDPTSRTPLLADDAIARAPAPESRGHAHEYRAADPEWEIGIDAEDERLYTNARALEFGDWNYPAITANEASRKDWMHHGPGMLTTSTNRNLLQPTTAQRSHRQSEIKEGIRKGKNRSTSPSEGSSRPGGVESKLKAQRQRSPSASGELDRGQLVDLIVEDTQAEEAELVRARKEGSDVWNRDPQRHFVRTYAIDEEAPEGQEIREGYDPTRRPARPPVPERAVSDEPDNIVDERGREQPPAQNDGQDETETRDGQYASLVEEDNVWK